MIYDSPWNVNSMKFEHYYDANHCFPCHANSMRENIFVIFLTFKTHWKQIFLYNESLQKNTDFQKQHRTAAKLSYFKYQQHSKYVDNGAKMCIMQIPDGGALGERDNGYWISKQVTLNGETARDHIIALAI